MRNAKQLAELVVAVRDGAVPDEFVSAYQARAVDDADVATGVVLGCLGAAGTRLAVSARRAVRPWSREDLVRTLGEMNPAEREEFARLVLGARA